MTSKQGPRVLVLGNHKGGSGRSTLAMHMAIGLMKQGKRVACLDLDYQQRSLTTYIENRTAWASQNGLILDVPSYVCIDGFAEDSSFLAGQARISLITSAVAAYEADSDYILIDTPAASDAATVFAHGLADTVVTPVNDSFLDLDVIFKPERTKQAPIIPPRYSQTMREALAARSRVTPKKTDWLVVRNRISSLESRNRRHVANSLEIAARSAGFRVADGLSERVIFREFFSCGLTAFDSSETSLLGVKPTTSHVLARLEVRHLLAQIQRTTVSRSMAFNLPDSRPPARELMPEFAQCFEKVG
jgi:chromosome partitioning protein